MTAKTLRIKRNKPKYPIPPWELPELPSPRLPSEDGTIYCTCQGGGRHGWTCTPWASKYPECIGLWVCGNCGYPSGGGYIAWLCRSEEQHQADLKKYPIPPTGLTAVRRRQWYEDAKKGNYMPPKKRLPVRRKTQPFPKVTGKPWKNHPGCIMVPVNKAPDHPAFPKVSENVLPTTYYIVSPADQRMVQLLTVLDDGSSYGWANCGQCSQYMTMCKCSAGLLHPDSVQWAKFKHEEWSKGASIDVNVTPQMEKYRKDRRGYKGTVTLPGRSPADPPPGQARKAVKSPSVASGGTSRRQDPAKTGPTHHGLPIDAHAMGPDPTLRERSPAKRRIVRTKAGSGQAQTKLDRETDSAAASIADELTAQFEKAAKKKLKIKRKSS